MWGALAVALAGGLAMFAANPPVGWWPLVFVAFMCLRAAVVGRGFWSAFLVGLIFGFAYFFMLFDWAGIAAGIEIARFALALLEALFVALVAGVWAGLSDLERYGRPRPSSDKRRKPVPPGTLQFVLASAPTRYGLAALAWVGAEELRGAVPFGGMPWGLAAFTVNDTPLIRLAPFGSQQIVGFVVVVIAFLLYDALAAGLAGRIGRSAAIAVGSFVLFAFPILLPVGGAPAGSIRVAVVQGYNPDYKLAPGESASVRVTKNHAAATEAILDQKPDLIVWPESASDRDVRKDEEVGPLVRDLAAKAGVPIVLGTQQYFSTSRYNQYLVAYPDGRFDAQYTKQHPVPFGEYMPYKEFFRRITTAVDQVGRDMAAGTKPAATQVVLGERTVTLATPICFEVVYSSIVSEAIDEGAQLLVVPTNNASFGHSGEAYQQFEMTRFRAVETGRVGIQVSTSGVSGIVEPNGVVRYQSDLFVTDARVHTVSLHERITPAVATAELRIVLTAVLGALAGIVGLCASILRWRDARAAQRTTPSRKKRSS